MSNMNHTDLINWGHAARATARMNADSITPDVPAMPGMDRDGYSSLKARERLGWMSIEKRLGASLEAALADDWRPLNWMRSELGDTL